jgi:hypothetical protein
VYAPVADLENQEQVAAGCALLDFDQASV